MISTPGGTASGVRPSLDAVADVALKGRLWKAGRRKLGSTVGEVVIVWHRALLLAGARTEAIGREWRLCSLELGAGDGS